MKPMFAKIDINKFALFDNFVWQREVKDTTFKKVNIIYGRNYSGKTTLSRIFRCVEKKELNEHYSDASFSLHLNNGRALNHNTLSSTPDDINVRVYNSDFVKDNLSWLQNSDGTIQPFTLLGQINVEIEKQIQEIDGALGSESENQGLFFEVKEKQDKHNQQSEFTLSKTKELEKKLQGKAKEISSKAATYNQPKYSITHIRKDINEASGLEILSDKLIEEKTKILKEEPKQDITKLTEKKPNFSDFSEKANRLLAKEIKPNQPITDLINDSLLQEWVRQGIAHHKNKRVNCGFCGNPIPDDLWGKIDAHFNKESEDLRKEINTQIEALKRSKEGISNYLKLNKDLFYLDLHTRLEDYLSSWELLKSTYLGNLDKLVVALDEREKDIFTQKPELDIEDVSEQIVDLFKEINGLIETHNSKTATLGKEQTEARRVLLLSDIAKFLDDIDYQQKVKEIKELEAEVSKLLKDKNDTQESINKLTKDKRSLEAQANDESKGAELVNQHLVRFFGHDALKLIAEGERPVSKFKIMRDGEIAHHLSEGECSLIAFCYFIAKIEDELNSNNLIIYIDDPISSLDSNHVFFVFSLIDSIIAKPKKYTQLFISTHNLDFLKYIKRITVPKEEINRSKEVAHFLIERQQKQNGTRSLLTKMPDHIKNYSTEFNYLFDNIYSIYNCTQRKKGNIENIYANTYTQLYNLPNNLRKFLECYLFFKYPNNESPLDNLDKLFDGSDFSFINRVVNENSHLTQLDRGLKPMDIDEVERCVKLVIEKIKSVDEEQYNALVASVK
jgi:wobble nucleotide-excising tRNase